MVFLEELGELFKLENASSLIIAYALIMPLMTVSQIGRRLLQKRRKYVRLFQIGWYSFLTQAIGISVAWLWNLDHPLILGFIVADLTKGLFMTAYIWQQGRGGDWSWRSLNHYQLGFNYMLNQVAAFLSSRGDIWLVSSYLSSNALAAYVIFKQFLTMIKATVVDPAEELTLPLLADASRRAALPKVYTRLRSEVTMTGTLSFLLFALLGTGGLLLFESDYTAGYAYLPALSGVAIVSLHSFSLGQLSVTREKGQELLRFKLFSAAILLTSLWYATESTLPLLLFLATLLMSVQDLVAEWMSQRRHWIMADVYILVVAGLCVGAASFLPLKVAVCALTLLTILYGLSWYHGGGYKVILRRLGY
jgi:hypothetical protein